jgi:hypothetical protein
MEGAHSAGNSLLGALGSPEMGRTESGRPKRNFGRPPERSGFVSCRFDGVVPEHVTELQEAMEPRDVTMKMVNMTAGGDIDTEVFEWIEHCNFFIIFGSAEYGQDTGNSACTYNEAKFAQGKGKCVILIRMIPFDEQFKHLQARVMFGLNKLEVPWMLGTPMPAELPEMLMQAMGLPEWVSPAPAPVSPSTPVRENEHWPDELAELVTIPEFVTCLAELDVHKFDDFAENVDAEDEGHDKLLMAVLEALPTKPRKKKLFRNRVTMVAQNLLQLLAIFIEYDTDEDGFLSRVECMRIPEHKAVAKTGGMVSDQFDTMDTNKDGRISFEELFDHCCVADGEEGVPPPDAEAEMQAARAAAEREKVVYEEMQAMKREQAALEAVQREQAAAKASQEVLAQQRAQLDEQAAQIQRQQLEFEQKSQQASVEAQRKMDEASRQLAVQAQQQAERLELQVAQQREAIEAQAKASVGPTSGGGGSAATVHLERKKLLMSNPKYPNIAFDNYRQQTLFHHINLEYPGLQLVSEKPYIFIVNNFLNEDECRVLLGKARGLQPQESARAKVAGGGMSTANSRKSKGCILWPEETPRFHDRVSKLCQVELTQQQPLKISRYDQGDKFGKHLDALSPKAGGTPEHDRRNDAIRLQHGLAECPYPGANRHITCFVYLNDVTSGGRTRWRWKHRWPEFYDKPGPVTAQPDNACHDEEGTHIAPEAGLAVIHFPATTAETGGYADVNACHEAEEAADTKFICQEFIWTHTSA